MQPAPARDRGRLRILRAVILAGMNGDRRPLGLPEVSTPATDRPAATERRALPPVDRALYLPPPATEPPSPAPARRPLADGGVVFSSTS